MTVIEISLAVAAVILLALSTTTTLLWLTERRRATSLQRQLDELSQPPQRRRLRVPTPGELARGAVGTAIKVADQGLGRVVRSSIDDLAGWANVQRPELVRIADVDGLVTILFSDIEDSTTLNHRIGDNAWVQLLRRHDRIINRAVDGHHGHVVKTQGDGFMVAFSSPADAVGAAVDIQQTISSARPGSRLDSVRVRIGIHRGPAVHRDNDLFGQNVAIAARVAGHADGQEILISDAVLDKLGACYRILSARTVELKGIPGTHAVHTVDWATTS
ncbi:MAG: adenylate/guanylate cyclase domain-containing protein [Gordonia sp. (in: high G+C Gram-positive bacteria)]